MKNNSETFHYHICNSWEYKRLTIINKWAIDVEEPESYFIISLEIIWIIKYNQQQQQLKSYKCRGRTQVYVQHLSHQKLSSMNTDLFPEGSSVNESYQNILGWEEVYSGLKPIIIRSHNNIAVTFHIGKSVVFISSKDYWTLIVWFSNASMRFQ